MKTNENSERLCDNKDCELIATHTLVWTEQQYYCLIHGNQALGVADAMGFPTPFNTFRAMTPDEMMPESEDE